MKPSFKFVVLFALALCVSLYACIDKTIRPADILKKKEFINILCDMHIADAYTESKGFQGDTLLLTNRKNFNVILKNYKIDSTTFRKTYNFYVQNPEDFDLVYLEVIDELSQMQADAQK